MPTLTSLGAEEPKLFFDLFLGSWEQWCVRILQKGHLDASEETASVQGSLLPRACVLSDRILQKGHLEASEETASVQASLLPRACVLSLQEQGNA